MNGFVKPNIDTQNAPEKMLPIDKNNSEIWLKTTPLSSHIEGYILAMQEKEINTNLLVAKRDGDRNTNCRLCKKGKESINT